MVKFLMKSSDKGLLKKAEGIAKEFADKYKKEGIVGIVFLGAIARGYFDKNADIDIIIFKSKSCKSVPTLNVGYKKVNEIEVDYSISEYESSLQKNWDMAERWAFSTSKIYYDPKGMIKSLLEEKVPLKEEERRNLMIDGIVQSEWYINDLSKTWVERGDLLCAFHQFGKGLSHFFNAIFSFNNELIPDYKWKLNIIKQMNILPKNFNKKLEEVLLTKEISEEEVERKRKAFMFLWKDFLPLVEKEVGLSFKNMEKLV